MAGGKDMLVAGVQLRLELRQVMKIGLKPECS